MRIKYIVAVVVAVAVGIAAYFYFKKPKSVMEEFAEHKVEAVRAADQASQAVLPDNVEQKAQFCPKPSELVKKDLKWATKDGEWENYTPSSATKVKSFIGAQWVGIKVGKIICLYQTDEAVSFPVALEQRVSQIISEPNGFGWSALVENRRFCKSASIADCPYFIEQKKDVGNVYDEIKYAPTRD